MNRIEYLQYEYYDARAKWSTAGPEELKELRNRLFRLSGLADNWVGEDGTPLAQSMRNLAEGIDDYLFAHWPSPATEDSCFRGAGQAAPPRMTS